MLLPMMPDRSTPVPSLTDRPALLRNRARANALGPVDFLHRIVADEVQDRLAEVNRQFTAPAVVTRPAGFLALPCLMPRSSPTRPNWT